MSIEIKEEVKVDACGNEILTNTISMKSDKCCKKGGSSDSDDKDDSKDDPKDSEDLKESVVEPAPKDAPAKK
jgi:hypothetical protein